MYLLYRVIDINQSNVNVVGQLRGVLATIILAAGIICCLLVFNAKTAIDYYIASICLVWGIWTFYVTKRIWNEPLKKVAYIKNSIFDICKKYFPIFMLIILILSLAYEECGYQFKWDGLLYYQGCLNASLSSISSLALYGHISQTYAGIIALLKYMFNDVGVAMMMANVLLLGIAIVSYYGVLKIILPGKKNFFYFAGTAILGFSSYYLGMVNYFSLDYCLMCLFPVVLYYTFKEKWIYQLVASILFCFTKETAIIIYGGLCAGIVIFDIIEDRRKKVSGYVKKVFRTSHYYSMALSIVMWFLTFLLLGPWNAGDSSVAMDLTYIFEKLKILYVFQFNWIFTGVIILYFLFACLGAKKKKINKCIFALAIAQVFFTLFSCIFKTVNHPRYIDSSVVFLYCTGTYCLTKLLKEKWQEIICVLMACILCISSYKSIDFISNSVFIQIDIGEEKIVTTYDLPFGDGATYNKQMLWMEQAMNYAIKDSISDDNIIVVPAIADYTYSFDGMSELTNTNGTYYSQYQYWNSEKNRREVQKNENNDEYLLYHISDNANMDIIPNPDNKNVSFIYIDADINYDIQNVLEKTTIIDEKNYRYRGWVLKRVVVKP